MTVAIPAAKSLIWLSKKPVETATAVTVTPTAITKARPAVVTAAATTGIANGMLIKVVGTGFPELDGKYFVATAVSATVVTLQGSNTLGSAGVLTPATAKLWGYATGTDLVQVCVSQISRQSGQAETVSVGTFCDPTATIPGTSTAGSASLAGYVDPTEAGYLELIEAFEAEDNRVLQIVLPDGKGSLILQGAFSGHADDFTLGQAISFTAEMGLSTRATFAYPASAP